MRNLKKFAAVALTACTIFAMTSLPAFAENTYSYKVTVSGGNYGTVSKDATVAYDGTYSISASDVTVTDSKYYVKGFAVSGDMDTYYAGSVELTVTEDTKLVAVYGIEGKNQVKYTVNYVDANGNSLGSDTFIGDIGDKPIVTSKYINGYLVTNAYALTKTLSETASENVFTFTYAPGTANATTTEVTNVVNMPTATTTGNNAATTATENNETTAENNNEAVAEENEEAEENATEETTVEEEETPEDIIDLDEEETPQADQDISSDSSSSALSTGAIVGIIAAIAAVIIIIVAASRRKKNS